MFLPPSCYDSASQKIRLYLGTFRKVKNCCIVQSKILFVKQGERGLFGFCLITACDTIQLLKISVRKLVFTWCTTRNACKLSYTNVYTCLETLRTVIFVNVCINLHTNNNLCMYKQCLLNMQSHACYT